MSEHILPYSRPGHGFVTSDRQVILGYPDYAREIGFIAAEWNAIEQYGVMLLAEAMDVRKEVVFPMAHVIVGNRLRLQVVYEGLKRLIPNAPHNDTLSALYDDTLAMLDRRNLHVHSVYADDKGVLYRYDVRPVSRGTGQATKVDLQELRDCVSDMGKLRKRWFDF